MWKVKVFKTREKMQQWLDKHEGKIQWEEIFVNNAYAVEYRPLRWIG